jgi:hypothetical protein
MKRHRIDVVSLIFGLVFLVLALSWMFGWSFTVHMALPRAGWILAAGLIVLGVLGLLRSLRSGRNDRPSEPDKLT